MTGRVCPRASSPEHPWVAATQDLVMWSLKPVRAKLVPLASGRVLEVGVGTGTNFGYYADVSELHGIEPDPHMLRRARARADELRLDIRLEQAGAEALPYEDCFFDNVVVTWVLCTIPEPEAALDQMLRVLKPGGRMLYVEHVRSRFPAARGLQDVITPLWRRIAGGCHLNRDSLELIRRAGFTRIETKSVGREGWTVLPMYRGTASKPA